MKKIAIITATASIVLVTLFCGAICASASFGIGTEVIASEVNLIKTGLVGKRMCFTDGDFKSALTLQDFKSITVTEIPSSTEGTLLLNGRRIGVGKEIKRGSIGALVFIPASESVEECSFSFTVNGYAGGAEIKCIMKFIDKINYAPEGNEGTVNLKTQESISVFATFDVKDPEGDALEYFIVSQPKRGTVSVFSDGSGRFSYTPSESFEGNDKFTYVARDEYGNYSKPQTVKIKVSERMCDTEYTDMSDREEYNAAVAMTAMGIMNGRMLGDDMYFEPDKTVTRAEFVTMAMKALGKRADTTLSVTFFDDDESIPESLRSYVATAQRLGYINGEFKDGRLLFCPNGEINGYEAAKILAAMINTDIESEESVFATDENIPVWARASVQAMRELGVFSDSGSSLDSSVTRASAADYLYKIIDAVK